jgi:hypothetical protein
MSGVEKDGTQSATPNEAAVRPKYEPPKIKVMDEQEVLSVFQVVQASGASWWVT